METIEYRMIQLAEMNRELFSNFVRHQVVTRCRRKVDGVWCVKDIPFVDDWTEENYAILVSCLQNTITTKGLVIGAFEDDLLKGFASVESTLMGKSKEYLDLSCIHVSEELRGRGIGKELFQRASAWAKSQGARKLYISAHSSVESQAFYQSMGCVEAMEYNEEHVAEEPCDCQLECVL